MAQKPPYGTPLAMGAMKRYIMKPSSTNDLVNEGEVLIVRRLIGTAGFVCYTARLDGLPAYATVSQYLVSNTNRNELRAMRLCKFWCPQNTSNYIST